ncbi:hypothetical protein JOF29_005159 [Kribbella aluminosa]|uniref:Uncharacterized protein n=1 Tax=Kribbella aluminosa TaxID=416017 RepID=A0ABS4UQY3_9ACTN|nr:hypothetical protein [Kribbella aluminosa]MBP2354049.1 hypothetical protein [Kribbella aluminosa]
MQAEPAELSRRGTCAGQTGVDRVELGRDVYGDPAVGGCEEDPPAVHGELLLDGLWEEVADGKRMTGGAGEVLRGLYGRDERT